MDVRLQQLMTDLRREIHRDPEVGLHLPRTQDRIQQALQGLPLETATGEALSSVVAVLRGGAGDGPVVLLRADMDALPVTEESDLPFAATGLAAHACGHDLHTAMLVGAAHLLAERRDSLAGHVVLMFQPGEEGFDGARLMVDEGVLDAAGHRPEAAYALHATSAGLPSGLFASRPGAMMAAAGLLSVTVRGAGGHGSSPHRAKDPVPAACEMVLALQTLVTRSFDIRDPVVLSVGSFHAGAAHNVIPDRVTFEASLRAFSTDTAERLMREASDVVHGIARGHGLGIDVEGRQLYPLTSNDADRTAAAAASVHQRFGEARYLELPFPLTASEDFCRVLDEVPGAMVMLGATPPDRDPSSAPLNHAPDAVFDEAVLADGASLYAELALLHVGAR